MLSPDTLENPLRRFMVETGYHTNDLPKIAGTYTGRSLVVVGDAQNVWEDIEKFNARSDVGRGAVAKDGWDFMTVNKAVETFCGHIEHAYSNEPILLNKFIAARRNEYEAEFSGPKHTHSCNRGAGHLWALGGHGTSGLGAVLVGIGLGYDRIALCGLPLDNRPHNGEPHWRTTAFTREAADNVATGINQFWSVARKFAFNGRVRSMSGRTLDWLGSATEWR